MLDPHDPGVWKNKPFKKGAHAPVSHVSEVLSDLCPTVIHAIQFWDKWHSGLVFDTMAVSDFDLESQWFKASLIDLCAVLLFP